MSNNKLKLVVSFDKLDRLSPTLKGIVGLGESGSRKVGLLRREAGKLNRELRETQRELAEGIATGKGLTEIVGRERRLKRAVDDTNEALKRQRNINRINAQRDRIAAQGERYKSAGRENMAQGATMLAPFAIAGKMAMDYDKQLALIGQKTDMNGAQTQRFGKAMLQAAKDAKQLPDNIIAGADFLTGKGLSVGEVETMMPALGRFATAWDADILDSAKAANSTYESLRVPLDQTSRSLEIMAAAGKAGGFEVKDMAQHFPKLSSQMSAMGAKGLLAVGDLSAALQVLEKKSGDGAQAATNLDNMMTFVQTERGIKKFAKFGIDIPSAIKQALAEGRSPLEEIARLTNEATGGDLSKIGLIFTNQQAAAGVRGLIQSMEDYKRIRAEAMGSTGLTDKEFDRMSETAAANWNSMKGALAGTAASLGTHLLPLMTTGFQKITQFVNGIAAWADENPRTAKTLFMLVGGLGALKLGVGATKYVFGSLLSPLASAWAGFKKFRELGGITGMVGRFTAKWKAVKSTGGKVFNTLKSGGASMFNTGKRAAAMGKKMLIAGGNYATMAGRFVLGKVQAAGSALWTLGKRGLRAGKRMLFAGASYAWMAGKFVAGKAAGAISMLGNLGKAALIAGWNFVKAGLMMLLSPIGLVIAGVAALAAGVYLIYKNWDTIGPWFQEKWAQAKAIFWDTWEWIKGLFQNYHPAGLIYTHWDSIAAWFGEKWSAVKSTFSEKWK